MHLSSPSIIGRETQGQFLNGVGLNSKFSFWTGYFIKVNKSSLPYYLHRAGGKDGFMPFPFFSLEFLLL